MAADQTATTNSCVPAYTNNYVLAYTNKASTYAATVTYRYDIDRLIEQLDKYEQTSELVRKLVANGKICRIFGHQWKWGRPGEQGGMVFADYHPGIEYRTCNICGKCESKEEVWR